MRDLIAFILIAFVINRSCGDSTCGETNLKATSDLKSFNLIPQSGVIPPEYNCTWTISGSASIAISLGQAQDNGYEVCVTVASTSIRPDTLLCSTDEPPKIISTDQPVNVTFRYFEQVTLKSFLVYYQETTEKPNLCGSSVHYAEEKEDHFPVYIGVGDIPQNHKCNWTIIPHYSKSVKVRVSATPQAGKAADPGQCVQVMDASGQTQKLCVSDPPTVFESTHRPITVRFPATVLTSTVKPFDVYYQMGEKSADPSQDCGQLQYQATENESSFDVPTVGGYVSDYLRCTWKIFGQNGRGIEVYLKVNQQSSSQQCVKVGDQVICARTGDEFVEVKDWRVDVSYPGKLPQGLIKGFSVFYRLGNNIDNKCGTTELTASSTDQSFYAYTGTGMIPMNHSCIWRISGPFGRSVLVYLSTDGDLNQCVKVSSTDPVEMGIICAQPMMNTFESMKPPLTVEYPGKPEEINVKNFEIFYKLAAVNTTPTNIFLMLLMSVMFHC